MVYINDNYTKLKDAYLFAAIRKKVNEFATAHPEKDLLHMGIGDVKLPLAPIVISAMHAAVDELGVEETFKGYGPEKGYNFLQNAIKGHYEKRDILLNTDEVFIGDGIKSDIAAIMDIFNNENCVFIPNPVYPAYVDVNIMSGRNIVFLNANVENSFLPLPPIDKKLSPGLIYLCSPNNPTGAVYNREQLTAWVEYAKEKKAIILFDAAYECFIKDESIPKSIYEIKGAKECAIEFCSLSKTAGFTGTRCGYTIVPRKLVAHNVNGDEVSINKLWIRRQTTKFNGVPYVVQRGAAAVFTDEGQKQIQKNIDYYLGNARIIIDTIVAKGIEYYGGNNSPYIWAKCFNNMKSWECFDYLLNKIAVVVTPGAGFGDNGEGFFRLTAFGQREKIIEAMERFGELDINI